MLTSKESDQPVNCRKCRHFYVTWDERFPNGCRLYGVKSKLAPSFSVRDATGAPCRFWEQSPAKRS